MERSARQETAVEISHILTAEEMGRSLHTHADLYEVMLVKNGNVDYFINDVAYHLEPGDVTLICPNDLHGFFIRDRAPYERIPIHINSAYAKSMCSDQTPLFSFFHQSRSLRVCHLNPEEAQIYENHAMEILRSIEEQDFGSDLHIRAHLTLLLLLVRHAYTRSPIKRRETLPPLVQDAILYINTHLREDLTVQGVADYLCISRSRISHLFKECTGFSLWDYTSMRRIQFARSLLDQGMSVTDTCYECGFHDYSNFIKTFKKLNGGISPGKYIKSGNRKSLIL